MAQHDTSLPVPVQLALQALDLLRTQDAALATQVAKSLPAYALKQAQSGTEVTIDSLLMAARAPGFGQRVRTAAHQPPDFMTAYQALHVSKKTIILDPDLHPPLSIAAYHGDVAEIRRLLDNGEDVNAGKGSALRLAAENGHTQVLAQLIKGGANVRASNDDALYKAARNGHTAAVALLLDNGASIHTHNDSPVRLAARNGHLDTVALLLARGADISSDNYGALSAAAENGHTDMVALLLDHGSDIHAGENSALRVAARHGHTRTVTLLLERGANTRDRNDEAIDSASQEGHTETVLALLDHISDITTLSDNPLGNAIMYNHPATVAALIARGVAIPPGGLGTALMCGCVEIADMLMAHGANPSPLITHLQPALTQYRHNRARWQKTARCDPPHGLHHFDPRTFKAGVFQTFATALAHEGYTSTIGNAYAYQVMTLLQTEARVLHYMHTWNAGKAKPLHALACIAILPGDLKNADLKAWGDAVLKHGPKMAKLAKFCDRIPAPLMTDDGKTWSYTKTRAEVAKHAYPRAAEHPALATLCFEHDVDEDDFNTALDLVKKAATAKNMPDITIDGARFGLSGATFKKLANDDVRGLFLGELTNCCQSIGNQGADCAQHGFTSSEGGFYAIETTTGEIIGQSWAWRGKNNELCFDSLETLGGRVSTVQWQKLLHEMARELTTRHDHDVTALHVGTGGNTPDSLIQAFKKASATPKDYKGYRDSKTQVRIWKR